MMTQPHNHLLVMAGGTGGHVFPALAVANALRAKGTRVTWLGTKRGLEAKVVPANDIDIHWISIEGLRGKGIISWFTAPVKLLIAIGQSLRALRLLKPDCVLGMGGFVSGPGGLAAWLLGTPLLVHEQNAAAGLTNKYLARFSKRVLTGFPNVIGFSSGSTWVGNPVRKEINELESSSELNSSVALNILVIGGSQGAHSFNIHLPTVIAEQTQPLNLWHQCGENRSEGVQERYTKAGVVAQVSDFIDDMAAAYKWADLLICRAGAMTIAECCAAGVPSFLIPFPHSAGDHQTINAEFLVDAGAAKMIQNTSLADGSAAVALSDLISDHAKLITMGAAAHALAKPNAVHDVVSVCEEYLHA